MKYAQIIILSAITLFIFLVSCKSSRYGAKSKGEVAVLSVHAGNAVDTEKLQLQTACNEGRIRGGIFDPTSLGTSALSMVATGIKSAIDKENKKYQASYDFNITPEHRPHKLVDDSMYFYGKNSRFGPFDFRDMKFTGFSVYRFFGKTKSDSNKLLAMRAFFELDTANLCEIAYDGIFRLRLKEIEIHYAKAKMTRHSKKINLDFKIQFISSYISKEGQLFPNVVLGTFTKTINGIILGDTASFRKFENLPLEGWSFVVPRSYFRSLRGDMWNQGSYSIKVTVKETSRPHLVNRLAEAEGGEFIDGTAKGVKVKKLIGK